MMGIGESLSNLFSTHPRTEERIEKLKKQAMNPKYKEKAKILINIYRRISCKKLQFLIKPDAVKRQLSGEILSRYERKGLVIKALKLLQVPRELAEEHYAEHKEKPFFGELVDFITSGPVLAFVLAGENAIVSVRALNGATNPVDAALVVFVVTMP